MLEEYALAKSTLRKLVDEYPDHKGAAFELRRSILIHHEQTVFDLDFMALYVDAQKLRPPHLDCATFSEPVVAMNSPGKGRGLFTTRDVKLGEVLLCEKGFARCQANSKTYLRSSFADDPMMSSDSDGLITTIVQKLSKNPSLLSRFNKLYHGSCKAVDVSMCDKMPVVDT